MAIAALLLLILGSVWGLGGFSGRNPGSDPVAASNTNWKSLFDGKTLEGWSPGRSAGRWKVEGGMIIGVGENSYLHSIRSDYRDFHVKIEARLNRGGNAGLFFRCDNADGLPNGYEAQIGDQDLGKLHRMFHGAPHDRSESKPISLAPGEWFTLEVVCQGNQIRVMANGTPTAQFQEDIDEHPRGHIALQAFSPETKIEVRKIEIQELP